MSRCFVMLALLVLASGCQLPASGPWSYAPPSPSTLWEPGEEEPPCALIDPEMCGACPDEPLALCALIELALSNSEATRQSWAQARIAAAEWGISRAPLYPELSAAGQYRDEYVSTYFGRNLANYFPYEVPDPDQRTLYSGTLSLSYLVFDWGTTYEDSESFRQALWQANWLHNRELQTIVQTVTTDFYTYLADQELVVASKANLRDAQVTLDATQKKLDLGISDVSDLLTAQTQVAKRDIQLLSDEQAEADQLTQLIADTGLPANTPICVAGELKIPSLEEIACSLECCLEEAYVFRPDLLAACAGVRAQEAAVRAAVRDRLPKLSLESSYSRVYHHEVGEGASREVDDFLVLFNLDIPLFQGFEYDNRIRSARAELEYAKASLDQLTIDVTQQVVQTHTDFLYAIRQVEINREYVELAERSYQATLAKYRAGTVDITSVVNAQTELADARYSLVEAKRAWFTGLADLAYVTGTLFQQECL